MKLFSNYNTRLFNQLTNIEIYNNSNHEVKKYWTLNNNHQNKIRYQNDNELIILAPDWSDNAKIFKMDFSGNISWIESPGYEIVRLIKSSDGKFIALMSSGGHDPSNNDGNTRVFFYNDSGYSAEFQLNNTTVVVTIHSQLNLKKKKIPNRIY